MSPASPSFFKCLLAKNIQRLTLILAEVSGVHHLQFKNRKAKFGKHRAG